MIIYNPGVEPVHGKTHQESVIFLIRKKGYKTFPVILKLGKNHKIGGPTGLLYMNKKIFIIFCLYNRNWQVKVTVIND